MFSRMHHIAIICSDYAVSKAFYTEFLGFRVLDEHYREERRSWKCDLVNGAVRIELFDFPEAPTRPTRPEARGLRHLAFAVASVPAVVEFLRFKGLEPEPVRMDPYTGALFTFFADPDGLPIEVYEMQETAGQV